MVHFSIAIETIGNLSPTEKLRIRPAACIRSQICIYLRDMADDLEFMMGKYAARIPGDRRFASNHLWLRPAGETFRVGFTAYSVRLLQDVYFLNWSIDPDTRVRLKHENGWLYEFETDAELLSPVQYVELLAAGWEKTQQMIKGQMNE